VRYLVSEYQFEPHVRIRKWFYRISFWVLAIFLLIALVRKSDWTFTFSSLQDIPVHLIILLIVGWSLSFLFRALRFQSEWKNQAKISLFSALHLTVLHNAAVVLVPFRVGELGYPVLVRKLMNVSWQQCIRSLLWLRFQDGLVLLGFVFLFLPFLNLQFRLVFLVSLILIFVITKKWWIQVLRSRHFLAQQLRSFLHQRSDSWGWLWSIANWSCKLIVVSVLLNQLTGLDHLTSLHGALSGELSALLPITGPAGLGTYEAGVWGGVGLPWTEMRHLMSSVLVTHLFFLSISLAWSGLFLMLDSFRSSPN
jgi:hypothetical protein